MCGIVGYTGQRPAGPIVLDGLRKLEYRGYDSAGIALVEDNGEMYIARATGKLDALVQHTEGQLPPATTAIGHTRWATHGEPSDRNAHPHLDPTGRVAVVHNGIIENFEALRARFPGETFSSDTDTEVLAHMLAAALDRGADLLDALRSVVADATGAYSLVVTARDEPGRIAAARVGNAGGLVIGFGDEETHIASDLGALITHTRHVNFLEPGEFVDITAHGARFVDAAGTTIEKTPELTPHDYVAAARGRYKHFMLKEIHEQPDAVLDALRGRYHTDPWRVELKDELPFSAEQIQSIDRAVLVGMGTSANSTLVGRHYFERFARIPSEVDNAAEFRYREPVLNPRTLVVSVAQSGETVDTLAAMDEAQRAGCPQITLCNTPGAQTTRVADGTLYLRTGPEVAVASTKTMASSMLLLHALALYLGRIRGSLDPEVERRQVEAALHLPVAIGQALDLAPQMADIARRYAEFDDFLFLGRGLSLPIAMEGALKLKEVSYIHAEGYAAGEMKHGPIALIDARTPTVAIAPRDSVFDKMRSNIEQVRARRGEVIAVVSHGDHSLDELASDVIELPEVDPLLAPIVTVVPLQLLAYYIALERGADIDQPRNLAKTVTVE
ncbi:MAG: glutamine--fructose-6-phosphate transaminase (isomerizing) [Chloroflexi bacterium]|nr:glutamine--fructose-6-phosphate transaminase (isomerizing) [Chloroflexota bacterium]MDA1146467.1 glutamine--fructose-6-phosphate transaminase (isomerizing) [Chloroflexota bacterium]